MGRFFANRYNDHMFIPCLRYATIIGLQFRERSATFINFVPEGLIERCTLLVLRTMYYMQIRYEQ